MAGRGRLTEVPAISNPHIFTFKQDAWISAEEPLHSDKPAIAGIGLAMSFADNLILHSASENIGLVPCAFGGTSLDEWMPGRTLYTTCVEAVKSCMNENKKVHSSANALQKKLSCILWHQGENDSINSKDAESYSVRLQTMLTALRETLVCPEVPVIAGELGSFLQFHDQCRFYQTVNAQLCDAAKNVPNMTVVSSEGLEDNGDHIHFNARSLREFGKRYAEKYFDGLK